MSMDLEEFEQQIKKEYLSEAGELLEQLETLFLKFEKDLTNSEVIDSIFRVAHTIKGSGFAAGFNDLAGVAHKFENILGSVRNGEMAISPEQVSVFLELNDIMNGYVEAMIAGEDYDLSSTGISEKLVAIAEGGDAPTAGQTPTSSSPVGAGSTELVENAAKSALIVDDEPDIRDFLSSFLEDTFESIETAENGEIALEKIKNGSFDLVVTDIYMPKMSGIELVQAVREFNKSIPIIFFSGMATKSDLMSVVNLGGVDFWDKPLDINRVNVSVMNAIHFKQTREIIGQLSKLNFRAYVDSLRLINSDPTDQMATQTLRDRVEATLDQIATLTNQLVHTDRDEGPEKAA